MNEYEKITRATRKKVSKITLQQQKEIVKLYDSAIKSLSEKISKTNKGSLNERFLLENRKAIMQARNALNKELNKSIRGFMTKTAKVVTKGEQQIIEKIFDAVGLKVKPTFNSLFTQVQNNVINDILKGNLYKDNKTLSSRIWNYGKGFEHDIQYIINQAILEKKSARELAKDLEKFVDNPNKRGKDWGEVYKKLTTKQVQYNATRLATTSINHAYQTATTQSANINPFVEGIKWHSSYVHGRTCDLCIERADTDQYGLGVGVFPKDDVPLDHPMGWCYLTSVIIKSSEEVGEELNRWLKGEHNPKLDKWYNEYGEHFATKKY